MKTVQTDQITNCLRNDSKKRKLEIALNQSGQGKERFACTSRLIGVRCIAQCQLSLAFTPLIPHLVWGSVGIDAAPQTHVRSAKVG